MFGNKNIIAGKYSGIILAGGRSSRHQGRNKAMIPVGGERIVDRIIRVLKDVFDDLIIVTNDRSAYRDLDVTLTGDLFTTRCSLTGIHAGLLAARHERAFVMACDAPFIKRGLIEALITMDHPSFDVTVPQTSAGYEPLCAVYSRRCVNAIERRLNAGRYKVSGMYPCLTVATVNENYLREADPELTSFFNVNTPNLISIADAMCLNHRCAS